MSAGLAFPTIRVGDPLRHEALAVFPLHFAAPVADEVDYLLSDEAVATKKVVVEEVSEGGSVPTLLVTNRDSHKVLFLEGEELRGAKQNRVLNTSVLIGAGSRVTIPVSCVEQGRWAYRSRHFTPSSDSYASARLRRELKASLQGSLSTGSGHRSDQGSVWREVGRQMSSLGSSSDTMAMSDTFASYQGRIDDFRRHLEYVPGAVGVAVALGPDVVAVDLFDKPTTCRKVWQRLLSGYVMDALEVQSPDPEALAVADREAVERFLRRLVDAPWQPSPAVGEGSEFRAQADDTTHASALTFGSSLIHGSAVAGTIAPPQPDRRTGDDQAWQALAAMISESAPNPTRRPPSRLRSLWEGIRGRSQQSRAEPSRGEGQENPQP